VVAALVRPAAVRRFLPADSGFRGHPIVRRGLPVIGLVLMPEVASTMLVIMLGIIIVLSAVILAIVFRS
jgi:hypothetical protein